MGWTRIKEYYGNKCAYCLRKVDRLTRDHIIPRSAGGQTIPENIVPACESCNQRKADNPIWTILYRKN